MYSSPAFRTPRGSASEVHLRVATRTGQAKVETLAMLDHTSADVAATIQEHIVDRKVNNSRTADASDPSLIEPAA